LPRPMSVLSMISVVWAITPRVAMIFIPGCSPFRLVWEYTN